MTKNNLILNAAFSEISKLKSLCRNNAEIKWIDKIKNLIIKLDEEVKI